MSLTFVQKVTVLESLSEDAYILPGCVITIKKDEDILDNEKVVMDRYGILNGVWGYDKSIGFNAEDSDTSGLDPWNRNYKLKQNSDHFIFRAKPDKFTPISSRVTHWEGMTTVFGRVVRLKIYNK